MKGETNVVINPGIFVTCTHFIAQSVHRLPKGQTINRDSIPDRGYFFQGVPTGPRAHPVPYSMGTRGSFLGVKATGA
jgi:hypothetical protein